MSGAEVDNRYFIKSRRSLYRYLSDLIVVPPRHLLNKNSSELSLPLFATAPFAAHQKISLVLIY